MYRYNSLDAGPDQLLHGQEFTFDCTTLQVGYFPKFGLPIPSRPGEQSLAVRPLMASCITCMAMGRTSSGSCF